MVSGTLQWFIRDAKILEKNLGDYCEDLTDSGAATKAKDSYKAAALTWSALDMMKMGPLHNRGDGDGLRDHVYSWPVDYAPCAVDQKVGGGAPGAPATKGLDALQYLLHWSQSSVCGDSLWDANSSPPSYTDEQKCDYLKSVAAELVSDAENAATAWTGFEDTFLNGTFAQGEQRSLAGDELVYHALAIFSDKMCKELKWYRPWGGEVKAWTASTDGTNELLSIPLVGRCGSQVCCPQDTEGYFAENSFDLLHYNFIGFQMIWYGISPNCDVGPGFRDLVHNCGTSGTLNESGPQLASRLDAAVNTMVSKLGAQSQSLSAMVQGYLTSGAKCKQPNKSDDATIAGIAAPFEEITLIMRDGIGTAGENYKKDRIGCTDMLLPLDVDGDGDG